MLHLVVVNKKRKEKKRNINNDLANLPSHNIESRRTKHRGRIQRRRRRRRRRRKPIQ